MLKSPRQLDMNGDQPILTPHGPAVLVPLAWLSQSPGLYALVCAERCMKRMGEQVRVNHVMQEAVKLTGACGFSHDTARNALRDLRRYGTAAGRNAAETAQEPI